MDRAEAIITPQIDQIIPIIILYDGQQMYTDTTIAYFDKEPVIIICAPA